MKETTPAGFAGTDRFLLEAPRVLDHLEVSLPSSHVHASLEVLDADLLYHWSNFSTLSFQNGNREVQTVN